jgi:hypothetical protein
MMDELLIEEMSVRAIQQKNGRSISRCNANTPTAVSKKPGTRNPKVVLGWPRDPAEES